VNGGEKAAGGQARAGKQSGKTVGGGQIGDQIQAPRRRCMVPQKPIARLRQGASLSHPRKDEQHNTNLWGRVQGQHSHLARTAKFSSAQGGPINAAWIYAQAEGMRDEAVAKSIRRHLRDTPSPTLHRLMIALRLSDWILMHCNAGKG